MMPRFSFASLLPVNQSERREKSGGGAQSDLFRVTMFVSALQLWHWSENPQKPFREKGTWRATYDDDMNREHQHQKHVDDLSN